MGEAVSQMYEKCGRTRQDHLREKFTSMMEKYGRGNVNMPTPSSRAFQMAAELQRVDKRVVGVDAELLATALADTDSKFLFTWDNTLLGKSATMSYDFVMTGSETQD